MTKEEAKKYLIDISYQLGTMGIECLSEKDGIKMREAIKALEQEPKTGHWIVWDTSSYDWTYKCDKCGRIVLKESDYCPKCGCRMVAPQESEEV